MSSSSQQLRFHFLWLHQNRNLENVRIYLPPPPPSTIILEMQILGGFSLFTPFLLKIWILTLSRCLFQLHSKWELINIIGVGFDRFRTWKLLN